VDYPTPRVHINKFPDNLCDVIARSLFVLRLAYRLDKSYSRMTMNAQFALVV